MFVNEIKNTNNLGVYSPAPGHYQNEAKSAFDRGAGVEPSMPKDARDFGKILLKKDATLIPAPGSHQTEGFRRGEYGTAFPVVKNAVRTFGSAARHFDARAIG